MIQPSSSITKGSMTGDLQPLSNVEESVSSSPKGGRGLVRNSYITKSEYSEDRLD